MTGIARKTWYRNVIHLQFNVLEPYKDKLAKVRNVAADFRFKHKKVHLDMNLVVQGIKRCEV